MNKWKKKNKNKWTKKISFNSISFCNILFHSLFNHFTHFMWFIWFFHLIAAMFVFCLCSFPTKLKERKNQINKKKNNKKKSFWVIWRFGDFPILQYKNNETISLFTYCIFQSFSSILNFNFDFKIVPFNFHFNYTSFSLIFSLCCSFHFIQFRSIKWFLLFCYSRKNTKWWKMKKIVFFNLFNVEECFRKWKLWKFKIFNIHWCKIKMNKEKWWWNKKIWRMNK